MLRTRYFVLSAAALFLCAGQAAAEPGVATGTVNMRAGPSTAYQVVAVIPEGAPVEIFGCSGWCEVVFDGVQGFVAGNYVASYSAPAPTVVVREPDYYYDYEPYYQAPGPSVGFYYYGDNDRYDRRRYRDRDRYGRRDRDRDRYVRRDRDRDRDRRDDRSDRGGDRDRIEVDRNDRRDNDRLSGREREQLRALDRAL